MAVTPPAALLERDPQLHAIERLLQGVSAGTGGSLFLLGEPGLGKTSVLAEAEHQATPRLPVGAARADAMETWLPFGPVATVLQQLGGPDLLRPGVDRAPATAARAATFLAVLRWLEADAGRPKLMVLDDLHWADGESLSLVAFIGRRAPELAVGVLGSLRPWPEQAVTTISALAAGGHAALERLQPLSQAGATPFSHRGSGTRSRRLWSSGSTGWPRATPSCWSSSRAPSSERRTSRRPAQRDPRPSAACS